MLAHPKTGQWDFHTGLASPRFLLELLWSGFAPAEGLSHGPAGPCRISPQSWQKSGHLFLQVQQGSLKIQARFEWILQANPLGAAPQLQGWEEQSPPCQEIAEATGLAPAHGLLPTPQSQQVSTQDTAWDFPPFSKGQQALGFIVKPQKRSFFHLGHHSEPTGQHCLQSRFSTGFPNYFIDSGIFQGIDIILMFGGKMRFPSLPPASLPVLHHCCLSRPQDKSLVPSRGLKVRISFLSAANSHREGWR